MICDTCPAEKELAEMIVVPTNRGPMRLCRECAKQVEAHPLHPTSPAFGDLTPEDKLQKLTDAMLFEQYLKFQQDAQQYFESLDLSNHPENYTRLEARIQQLSLIQLEAKTKQTRLETAKREYDYKTGKGKWAKESGPKLLTNFSTPGEVQKSIKAEKKAVASKLEKRISGMLLLGESDDDILALIKPAEVTEAKSILARLRSEGE